MELCYTLIMIALLSHNMPWLSQRLWDLCLTMILLKRTSKAKHLKSKHRQTVEPWNLNETKGKTYGSFQTFCALWSTQIFQNTCSNPQQGLTQNNQSSLEISGARFGPMSEQAAGGNSMPATCHLSLNTSKYHEIPSCWVTSMPVMLFDVCIPGVPSKIRRVISCAAILKATLVKSCAFSTPHCLGRWLKAHLNQLVVESWNPVEPTVSRSLSQQKSCLVGASVASSSRMDLDQQRGRILHVLCQVDSCRAITVQYRNVQKCTLHTSFYTSLLGHWGGARPCFK